MDTSEPEGLRYEVFTLNDGLIPTPDSPFFEDGVCYRWVLNPGQVPQLEREPDERQLLLGSVVTALNQTIDTLPGHRSPATLGGEDGDVAQHFLDNLTEALADAGVTDAGLTATLHSERIRKQRKWRLVAGPTGRRGRSLNR